MPASIKLLLSTTLGAVLSAVYWVVLFQVFYAMSAGDYSPDHPQPEGIPARALLVGAAGFAIYVAAAWLWRSIELRWMSGENPRP